MAIPGALSKAQSSIAVPVRMNRRKDTPTYVHRGAIPAAAGVRGKLLTVLTPVDSPAASVLGLGTLFTHFTP